MSTIVLPFKTIDQSIIEAEELINRERSGEQYGLYCRWNSINRGVTKYFRFANVYYLAGASGSGKSYILNMLEDDFTNPLLNGRFKHKVLILSFKYEMTGADEVIRNVAGKLDASYSKLLSSDWEPNELEENGGHYNQVTDEQFNHIHDKLETLKGRPIYYFETAGNLTQAYNTVKYYTEKFPDHKIVVTLDHTLLSKKHNEKDDLELSAATGQLAIALRKQFGAMVILLGQLNGEIEKVTRIENATLHYPKKTDIHCGNQIFWACDVVIIFHRPELLGIKSYGMKKINTTRIIHASFLKVRNGSMGNAWLEAHLEKGKILEAKTNRNDVKKSENKFGI